MRHALGDEKLKSGEKLDIECVLAPDGEMRERIEPFLAHKPPQYIGHIQAAFAGACGALETRFYVGLIGNEMVGNIMTVETAGIGIFGHVHTASHHRRKGICSAIMRRQMEDFRRRNGHVLLLGTGYQSAAYNIYQAHGFTDLPLGRPGLMRYDTSGSPETARALLTSEPAKYISAEWRHWPLAALLASEPGEPWLRSVEFDLRGVGLLEGPFSKFLYDARDRTDIHAAVAEARNGMVVAVATVRPESRWRGDTALLDLFAHPSVNTETLVDMLTELPFPAGRAHCYTDARSTRISAALEAVGFSREAKLAGLLRDGSERRDVWLYARRAL
jgi:GNAT superfamily N-acetyltransferase